jgi:hypothetical protein
MAGFAVVMTVLTYGFFALIAAGVSSLCLYFYAKRRVREGTHSRKVIATSAVIPFLALLWLIAALLIHVAISNYLAHQDCGFSPDPYVTLPNGYTLGSHNTYDGYFKAPGFETDIPVAGPGYVRGIIDLQLSNGYFTGTQLDFKTSKVRSFVFDTRTRAFQTSDTSASGSQEIKSSEAQQLDAFTSAQTSVQNDDISYWKLYAQYRHHWPNYILVVLIIAGEAAIGFWVQKVWASARIPTHS